MSKKFVMIFIFLIITFLLGGCFSGTNGEKTITVSAAASMKDVLGEIEQQFEITNPGIKVRFNFGSSGTLQQQIQLGAPVDVFISAGKKQMSVLQEEDFVGKPRVIAGNQLVVVVHEKNSGKLTELKELTGQKFSTIATGTPETVPAGKYAEEALKKSGIIEQIRPKLVPAKDVRQVLAYVETGEADAGFIYRTDAGISQKVDIVYVVPDDLHSPIDYPAAVVKSSLYPREAELFLSFLGSRTVKLVFEKHGFTRGD